MLIPHLEVKIDGAWTDLTEHGDLCALAGASIQWGTTDITSQPEPTVMSFSLRDLDARLAQHPTWLTGRQVRLWFGPGHTVVFNGVIASGLQVRPLGDGWRIDATATGLMVLWKRLRDEGPAGTMSPNIADQLHWNVTPADRVTEMNRRARQVGAPTIVDDMPINISSRNCITPQLKGEYPSQLTLLHASFMDYSLPLWFEYPDDNSLRALRIGKGALIALDKYATPCVWVTAERQAYKAIAAGTMRSGRDFQLAEPYTGVTFKFKKLSTDGRRDQNDRIEFTAQGVEIEHTVSSTTLPKEIRDNVKNIVVDSDLLFDGPAAIPADYDDWRPFTSDETELKNLIDSIATRLTPTGIVIDADDLSDVDASRYIAPRPRAGVMIDGTNLPFDALGPYAIIGGVITIDARDGVTHATHELTLSPVASPIGENTTTWEQIPSAWTATYTHGDATLDYLCHTKSFLPDTSAI